MTFKKLQDLLEKYNISNDVELLSDSGWECDETEMNGVYYNEKDNHIIFTQFANDTSIYNKYYKNKDYKELK